MSFEQIGLCYSLTWNILHMHLNLKAWIIEIVQKLKPNENFVNRALK